MKRRLTRWQSAWRFIGMWALGLLVFAGYLVLTGLISAGLAWESRRPRILGPMAWLC